MAKKVKKKQKTRKDKGGTHAPGAGRPLAEFDPNQFKKLCEIQCTMLEITGIFDTTEKTLIEWVKRTYGENFSSVYKKLSAGGKMSLRRSMFRNAIGSAGKEWTDERGVKQTVTEIKPSATSQIWLSKQHLGMSDKTELEITAKPYVIESPDGKDVITLGVEDVREIDGDTIDVEAIEDSESKYYEGDLEDEPSKDEQSEPKPGMGK